MEEQGKDEVVVSDAKIKKLRNLRYFRNYTNEKIRDYVIHKNKGEKPPEDPNDITSTLPDAPDLPALADDKEIKKKFQDYFNKYRKEFSVDMNDANDAESLRSLARYMVQAELIDRLILNEQLKKSPVSSTLKGFGDFQRAIQQNINEIQQNLGISRKARKEKQVDDIPEWIASIQKKAAAFWERSTVAIKCEKCKIELARYWVNFPDIVQSVKFELTCDKCKERVIYVT